MAVTISDLLPRDHVGDEIKPVWPHEFIMWLWRLFGLPVYPICYVRGKKIEEDRIFILPGQLHAFMSKRVYDQLKPHDRHYINVPFHFERRRT